MPFCFRRAPGAARLAFASAAMATLAAAAPITPAAFSAGRIVESFEGLTPGPNLVHWGFLGANGIWFEPGRVSAYEFPSGARLTSPIPNPDVLFGNVLTGDYSLGSGGWLWSLGANGNATAADIPTGDSYFGFNGDASVVAEFSFPQTALRVGAWITTDTTIGNTATIIAYDRNGTYLESVSATGVLHNEWRTNFLGMENSAGIARIVIVGNGGIMDDLTFDLMAPEPSSIGLALAGLLLISLRWFARRGIRKRRPAIQARRSIHPAMDANTAGAASQDTMSAA